MTELKRTRLRAKTDEEKLQVIKRLTELWLDHPDLRLGQLIGNVFYFPSGIDPYHYEDSDFIAMLENGYNHD